MKRHPRILAGTALGLLMASAPLAAFPLQDARTQSTPSGVILAQAADCPEGQNCEEQDGNNRRHKRDGQKQGGEESGQQQDDSQQPRRQRREKPAQEEQQAPAADQQQAEPEQQPRRQRREKPAQEEQQAPAAEQQPAEPEQQPRRQRREKPAQQEDQAPAAEQQQAEPEQEPRRPRKEQPKPEEQQVPAQQAAPSAEPQPEAAPAEEPQPQRRNNRRERPADEGKQPADVTPPAGEAPTPAEKPAQPTPEQAPAPQAAPEAPASGQPAAEAPEVDPNLGPNAAPVLDSQKEAPRERPRRNGKNGGNNDGEQATRPAPDDQGPPPTSDAAATEAAQPKNVEPVTAEKGRRVERGPDDNDFRQRRERRDREEGGQVKELGDRLIIRLGDHISVESNDRPRMSRNAQDVYYEDLPRGRTRETIVRDDGTRVVTIRDEYGTVVRRSRITRDGREYVLSYVDEDNYDRVRNRRDPGDDLPPMRLNIPIDEYILDAEDVNNEDDYYEFLEQPPVERVERLYSVDEVKRSARVRDIARRVDMDTLTFEFGAATIPESEITKLEGVANAMEKLLDKNPAETFLIEGHTDAVGSEEANLALSDRRAEAVAEALTNVFAIPPENLATQGYGERYLKVKTDKPEQQNRRVGIRRITPLVAPVASAN